MYVSNDEEDEGDLVIKALCDVTFAPYTQLSSLPIASWKNSVVNLLEPDKSRCTWGVEFVLIVFVLIK